MYDMIIIGGGIAGISAGIYAARSGRKALLIEKAILGGRIAFSDVIKNYAGFPSIRGLELAKKFEEHAKKSGVEILDADVKRVENSETKKVVRTSKGDYEALSVIVASGSGPKKLGVKGEEEFANKGVQYCAVCDGPLFAGKNVAVVGTGGFGLREALFLANIAGKVTIINSREKPAVEYATLQQAYANPKVSFVWNCAVEEISGDRFVRKVLVRDLKTNKRSEMPVDAVFIYVGVEPSTGFVDVKKEENGTIVTDESMRTDVKGIYAAGDCRAKRLRQIVISSAEGAIAAVMAGEYLESLKT